MNEIAQFAPVSTGQRVACIRIRRMACLFVVKRVILADDMGLQTCQAIVAMEAGAPDGKVLVVCPAS